MNFKSLFFLANKVCGVNHQPAFAERCTALVGRRAEGMAGAVKALMVLDLFVILDQAKMTIKAQSSLSGDSTIY